MSGRIISRAESWDITYQAWQDINFAGFDFVTIKSSMIDYIKLYFPETFNDYIESSEFIGLLELFAYLGEILIYRVDVGAHENFMPLAQRKQSVLRLAKLVSYNGSRNIPARGLVKITSVTTTEPIIDSQGINLQNKRIIWNDTTSQNWKERFILVINQILSPEQPFGTVSPTERFQVQDVLFELYNMNNTPGAAGVISYNVTASGQQFSMELVPVSLDETGPYERRPEINSSFSLVYGSDGLGDSSTYTGFFMLTKQGQLGRLRNIFDGRTPNQTIDITPININDTDLWVNNVDPDSGKIVDNGTNPSGRSGEWVPVDTTNAENILFNTNVNLNKYEVETLESDSVRIIFGDNQFAHIPSGTFDFWYRVSANEDLVIPQNSIIDLPGRLNYTDDDKQPQSFSFTYSLTNSLQNASVSEDIEHIRNFSGGVYYSQERMVNARDYNTFMLQDPTIVKLKSINRTFAGESKYVAFTQFGGDPSEAYDNVRMFGVDLALYFKPTINVQNIIEPANSQKLTVNYIEPLLSDLNLWQLRASLNYSQLTRKAFLDSEKNAITYALGGPTSVETGSVFNPSLNFPVEIYFDNTLQKWRTTVTAGTVWDPGTPEVNPLILISIQFNTVGSYTWTITVNGLKTIAESPSTRFWFVNKPKSIVFDTNASRNDLITVLQANIANNRSTILSANQNFIIVDKIINDAGLVDQGLPNNNQVEIMSDDANGDKIPDNPTLHTLIDPTIVVQGPTPVTVTVPISYIRNRGDVRVAANGTAPTWYEGAVANSGPIVTNKVTIANFNGNATITITIKDYVYFQRIDVAHPWYIIPATNVNKLEFHLDVPVGQTEGDNFKRLRGRNDFNFIWFHHCPQYNLVDPAATNLIDTFVITKGYYNSIRSWLAGIIANQPDPPTPFELRTSYNYLLGNRMISDSVILHPGKFRVLFGGYAIPELQGTFKIVRSPAKSMTDNQIKLQVIASIRQYFDINKWEFGETFYFTELAAFIHADLPTEIETVVLVPVQIAHYFGDLFQVDVQEDEILIPSVDVDNIEIVESLTKTIIKQVT